MRIRVTSNVLEVSGWVRDLLQDQLPFAVKNAVRATALDFQDHQRRHQRNVFTVRSGTFLDRGVKIRDWPTKADPTAIIRVEPPGGPERVGMISDHEESGIRPPGPGHTRRSVPDAARPSRQQMVNRALRPKKLGLKPVGPARGSWARRGGAQVFRGNRRTFMIQRADGGGVILQRVGPGRFGDFSGTRVLFRLVQGGVRLPGQLAFHRNAELVVDRVWPSRMAEAWDYALRTAR